jgi:hypothetical protein
MNTPSPFNFSSMQFSGTPLEQAKNLLRLIKRLGDVEDTPRTLPPTLTSLLSNVQKLGFTKEQLRKLLAREGVLEANIGGSLDKPVARANNNDEDASFANYFVIHDTSTPLHDGETFDPDFIDTSKWSGNWLENNSGDTHVFITRNGRSKTQNDYQTPYRATRFESKNIGSAGSVIHKGRFLHHELIQPRLPAGGVADGSAPKPGFTPEQYKLLALCYFSASLRRGQWLIPVFHAVLDLGFGDHDDPQSFDLDAWDNTIAALRKATIDPPASNATLKSRSLKDDPNLQKVARSELILVATGDVVPGIGAVQDALNRLGKTQPELIIQVGSNRGSFGPRTKTAVIAFQKLQGLPQTGKVDADTLLKLDSLLTARGE